MNITIIRSTDVAHRCIYQSILDCIDGKTIIITTNTETEANWRLQIITARNNKDAKTKVIDLAPVFINYHFLHSMDRNQDEISILNYRGYKNLILDNVWTVFQNGNVSSWITAIKTANPDINFIGISDTAGESYKTRIDQRIKDIKVVMANNIKETMMKLKEEKEDLPPCKAIHLCQIDISGLDTIEPCSYSPTGRSTIHTSYVSSDLFLDRIKGETEDEIRVYARVPKTVQLLCDARRFVSTCMVYSPTPLYGRRMSYLTTQLNKLFGNMEATAMRIAALDQLPHNWQINIREQKSIMFCDYKKSDEYRKFISFYVKPDFPDGSLRYAIEQFSSHNNSVLCIEGQRIGPTVELLDGCKNVFLFGTNKYDSRLIKHIMDCSTDDINIVMFVSKNTIDESNVLSALECIKDNSLTVLKHDLSS